MSLEQSLKAHIKKITEDLQQQRTQAQQNIKKAQQRQKEYYDKKIIKPVEFQIGEQVLIYDLAKDKNRRRKNRAAGTNVSYVVL
ncbi:21002_t:CDS:2 [Gigaspora rosea]|nr:21002_t:CDS:2 [Gigaspora rosea]